MGWRHKICYIFSKLIHLQWELTSTTDMEFIRVAVFGMLVHEMLKHLWVKMLTRKHGNKHLGILQILLQKAAFVQQANNKTWGSSNDIMTPFHPLLFFLLWSERYCEESLTEVYSLFTPMCVWKVISLVTYIAMTFHSSQPQVEKMIYETKIFLLRLD